MGNTSNNARLKRWISESIHRFDGSFTTNQMADLLYDLKGHRFSNRRVGSLLRAFANYDMRDATWRKR